MVKTEEMKLSIHQSQLVNFPFRRPDLAFFFLIGGYGCGKTLGDALFIFKLIKRYAGHELNIGVGSVTIGLLYKTFLIDLEKLLIKVGITYSKDRQRNIIKIGTITILMFALDQPELIFGPNLHVALLDEIDELPLEKVEESFKAVQERVRLTLPDGRKPYTICTTTSQGLRGMYELTEKLKKEKQPFALIRGKTKDNPNVDKSYYEKLYALYNENERLAFLEGQFVNLTSGRVYYAFDDRVHVIKKVEITPQDVIYIGQDLNTGFSKAVAFIVRDSKLIAVKDFSFPLIGNAPLIIRGEYPQNRILWFPDASSKEIFEGYRSEIMDQGIELMMGRRNPPILERIFLKNKLIQTGRMFVTENCQDYIKALKTRCFDKNGMPEKGNGEKSPDHLCDGAEYSIFRLVSFLPELFDLWSLTRTYQKDREEKRA